MSDLADRLNRQFADSNWIVQITFATRDDLWDQVLDLLTDRVEHLDLTVARRADASGVVHTGQVPGSEVQHLQEAIVQVLQELTNDDHLEVLGLADVRMVAPEVYAAEMLRPDTPELLAATDMAEILGVSRQRVHQLSTDHPAFPEPYVRLGSGPIWTRPAIDHFNLVWERKPGRPTRKAG
ncbi:MAG TPA: hypothetical protein VGH89_34415 [Pseudonocardia sp.]|jgi:hypothetical protein